MTKKTIALMSTGGTIEKTYDPLSGVLENQVNVLDILLSTLELRGVEIQRMQLCNKDSMAMTKSDHQMIATFSQEAAKIHDGVVVVHGTDRLTITGETTLSLGTPANPIVFTGAMRPYELRHSDASQNMAEALLAAQILDPGVYTVMHNQVLQFPGVIKDLQLGSFRMGP
tara:strand:- start:129 stop:638 length:510 start_codon:yes stop_codon:yes gene_type:complete